MYHICYIYSSYLPWTGSQILLPCTLPGPWDVLGTGYAHSWMLRGSTSTKHSGKVSRQWCKNCQIISEWGVPPVFLDNWTATINKKKDKLKVDYSQFHVLRKWHGNCFVNKMLHMKDLQPDFNMYNYPLALHSLLTCDIFMLLVL